MSTKQRLIRLPHSSIAPFPEADIGVNPNEEYLWYAGIRSFSRWDRANVFSGIPAALESGRDELSQRLSVGHAAPHPRYGAKAGSPAANASNDSLEVRV